MKKQNDSIFAVFLDGGKRLEIQARNPNDARREAFKQAGKPVIIHKVRHVRDVQPVAA